MSLLKIFQHKKEPVIAAAEESFRCKHIFPSGRRCTLTIPPGHLDFCAQHRTQGETPGVTEEQRQEDMDAVYAEVMGPIKSLDSAVAINHVLSNLFRLTLQGRIPQRKAATLTTQLRALLRSAEAAKHEIITAKLFPQNHGALLALLALLNGDNAESETVAPNSSLHRVSPGGRTCSAVFSASDSTCDPEPAHTVVAPEACAVSASRVPTGNSPASGQTASHEDPTELTDATNRKTVAPNFYPEDPSRGAAAPISTAPIPNLDARFPSMPNVTSPSPAAPKPGEASLAATHPGPDFTHSSSTEAAVPNRSSQTQTNDGVCWIGPKPDQIDWARIEEEKKAYERYLRQAYPPTLNGYHRIPPDKIPLWWKQKKRR